VEQLAVVAWILAGWVALIVVVSATLMAVTKVRKLRRDRHVGTYPHIEPPVTVPIGGGSTATTYTYGERLYEDMIAAIESADERILFETYMIKADRVGRRFKQALTDAAARGVDVYVVYDAFGNLVVSPRFLRFPRPIHSLRFPVLRLTLRLLSPRVWGRDHRKILAVDGRVAFVGGYNIGTLYATDWRDTHVRIEGAAVWELVNAFVDFWNTHKKRGPGLRDEGAPTWDPTVRAHRNVPSQLTYPIRTMYLEAIDRARQSIRLTAAYFLPDRDIVAGLIAAARRDVRVEVLLPAVSNHVITDWLARGFFGELLDAGVRIHRYDDWMVHAKTITIDGEWSSIGTANIDRLSLTGNYEINLEIHSAELAAHLNDVFELDLTNAKELTAAEWGKRGAARKGCEWLLRPLRPLL
jgi:cardiolipin synthase